MLSWRKGGSSARWTKLPPQRLHAFGSTTTTSSTSLGGSIEYRCPLCPGCSPGLRPDGCDGLRTTPGGSDDGGLDELVEFCWSCASKEETFASSSAIRANAHCNCLVSLALSASSSAMRRSFGSVQIRLARAAAPVYTPSSPFLLCTTSAVFRQYTCRVGGTAFSSHLNHNTCAQGFCLLWIFGILTVYLRHLSGETMDRMDRIKFVQHAGKQILRVDFTNSTPEQVIETIGAAEKIVRKQPKNSVLAVTLVDGAGFNDASGQAFKEYAAYNKPFVRATAVVGVKGLQNMVFRAVAMFSKREIGSFDDEATAMDWLASR
jgi:hypothetical protein